jgi:hypothetical protein
MGTRDGPNLLADCAWTIFSSGYNYKFLFHLLRLYVHTTLERNNTSRIYVCSHYIVTVCLLYLN